MIQLQTNFRAARRTRCWLYHIFAGRKPATLAGVEAVMNEAGRQELPAIRRAVLVGKKISPGNPSVKADGTVVRRRWGELGLSAGKVKANLTADEAVSILKGTTMQTRNQALADLAPRLKNELGGTDLTSILDNLKEYDRSNGVRTLVAANRVKGGLTANETDSILNGTSGTARSQAVSALASTSSH